MKKLLVLTSLAALTAIGYSCSPKVAKSTSTATPSTPTAVSAEILAEGKKISETNCGKCHRLHDANEYTVEKWNKILDRMIPKAKLAEDQGSILRQYYVANAQQG